MRVWIIRTVLVIMIFGIVASEGLARRTHFTPEQKAQLQAIQTVWVKVLALTERGKAGGQPIQDIVQERLTTIGYQIATSREEPSDVMFMVKCEERKNGPVQPVPGAMRIMRMLPLACGQALLVSLRTD